MLGFLALPACEALPGPAAVFEGSASAGAGFCRPACSSGGFWGVQGFGQEVTVISTSPNKEKEAREVLGADHFVVSKDEQQMAVRASTPV